MISLLESIDFFNGPLLDLPLSAASSFLPVSNEQVQILTSQGNTASEWSNVFIIRIADNSTLSRIRRCCFDGIIFISSLIGNNVVDETNGITMPSGLYDTMFTGKCFIGDFCRVSDTTVMHNVCLGIGVAVINCGFISYHGCKVPESHFDGVLTISVGPETGGRDLIVRPGMSYLTICQQLFGVSNASHPTTIDSSPIMKSSYCIIGDGSLVVGCDVLSNSLLGQKCRVSASSLDNSILLSTRSNPILVSGGARLSHCILNEACSATNRCHAEHVYMSEHSSIGDCAKAIQSILGPDSSVAQGECQHSVLGPFVGFHHQSLLIATVWPQGRGNIAYGAMVGANHTGRVSDQECWPGEGIFFGLSSAVKFPCNLLESPYSIIASGTMLPPQKLSFPFSLISTLDRPLKRAGEVVSTAACTICPGWVLQSNPYMIDRASKKFSSRRKARNHRTDYPVLRPWVMNLVRSAYQRLLHFQIATTGTEKDPLEAYSVLEVTGLGLCLLSSGDLNKAVKAYSALLRRYSLHGLLYFLLKALWSVDGEEVPLTNSLFPLDVTKGPVLSPWQSLSGDLQLFVIPPVGHSDPSKEFLLPFIVTDSHIEVVLKHQLLVLTEEFPAVLLEEALKAWTASCSEHRLNGRKGLSSSERKLPCQGPVIHVSLVPLIVELSELEETHAVAVEACRARDGVKGRSIIEDYNQVNAAGADTLSDPIVKEARDRAKKISDIVSGMIAVNL